MAKTKTARKVTSPVRLGEKVFIRTVTHYYTGRISLLSKDEIVLSDAAWIACTARWADTLSTGALSEVEPFPGVVSINRGAVVDVTPWPHPLPRGQK